ncbi:hypothetical protein D9M70_448290 [compost metagenome]
MAVCVPAIRIELPKACQTLGNWTAPLTSPIRDLTTEAKSGSHRKMKLPRCRSGPTSRAKAKIAIAATAVRPIHNWRRLCASAAVSQKATTDGTTTAIERHRTAVSATPALAEKAIVTSQK